jgi:hypothetical protein
MLTGGVFSLCPAGHFYLRSSFQKSIRFLIFLKKILIVFVFKDITPFIPPLQ